MDNHPHRCLHPASPRILWAGVLTVGILIGGCGTAVRRAPAPSVTSSTAGSAGSASSATAAEYAPYYKVNGVATLRSGSPLAMQAGDFAFSPNTLSTKIGTPVRLDVDNTSPEAHNFALPAFAVNTALPAGRTTTVTFTPTKVGTYYFYCNLPGHPEAGMVGKLTVSA